MAHQWPISRWMSSSSPTVNVCRLEMAGECLMTRLEPLSCLKTADVALEVRRRRTGALCVFFGIGCLPKPFPGGRVTGSGGTARATDARSAEGTASHKGHNDHRIRTRRHHRR
jgi:hypothetical protein